MIDCKTKGFVYVLWSKKVPEKVYVGSSCRQVKDRLREHRRDIEEGKQVAVANHFGETRSAVSDIVFRPVMKVKSNCRWVLRHFESRLINELNVLEEGVNRILT